ncbi:ABC transporter permease [uncultured Jatrophihabitans sp.]|uniref:ABC transporter permease n=1 Tax=uncultured Jatrophihabitans sp. TaxID=1610747 RepID=UPI0035CC65CF
MSTYVLFLLLGLGAGSVYALLGLGMVLKYRSTGVVDFAQGASAMWGAYTFLNLRNRGELELPLIWLPHEIKVSSSGLGVWPALVITLVYGTVLGLIIFMLVYRPLLHAAPLTKVCASVGVALFFEAVAVLNFGTTPLSAPPILPSEPITIGSVIVPSDRLYLAGIVVLVAVGLTVVFRFTRFGLATRAGAENETGAALIGISATRIAARNWMIATLLATLSGILITPISSLDPTSYTLFVVPALGAVLIGRFNSFWITAAAGLLLGIVQSELIKLQTVFTWLPQQGLADGVPFVIILVTMTLSARRLGARGATGTLRNPSLGRPTRPVATSLIMFVLGVVVLVALHGSLRAAFMSSIVTMCLAFSLVVLTGYVGQVSLAQMSFAGIGAFVLSHLTQDLGVPFPFSLILSALAVVPIGILIGLPALRVRGVNLAVVTLAAAAAMDALVFSNSSFSGGLGGRKAGSPSIFGLDLGIAEGRAYPRVVFGVLLLVIVTFVGYCVARLRTSATGRMLVAVRSNERAAAAVGIRVAPAKLYVFALSSFIAGIGGALLAYEQGTVSSASFGVQTSLTLLAIAYVAGIGRIAGAVVAGLMFASDGLFVSFLDKTLHIGKYQMIVAGIALAITAIKNPDGVASEVAGEKGLAPRIVRLRDRLLPGRKSARATSSASGSGPVEQARFDKAAGPSPVG